MCVSINSARGAKTYINEWLKNGGGSGSANHMLQMWQKHEGWLMDHEIRDRKCQPKLPTGKPGMKMVKRAIDEVNRIATAEAPRVEAAPKKVRA